MSFADSLRELSIIRDLSRREVERHAKRFNGITVTEPEFRTQDDNGLTEWVCDVRVGTVHDWSIVKGCLIAQWALGVVTDVNVPVVCERSESGRVTIIARANVLLPDVRLDVYTYEEMGFSFMRNLTLQDDGSLVDGYGYEVVPAGSVEVIEGGGAGVSENKARAFGVGPKNRDRRLVSRLIEWGSTDFEYGVTLLGARVVEWIG